VVVVVAVTMQQQGELRLQRLLLQPQILQQLTCSVGRWIAPELPQALTTILLMRFVNVSTVPLG
jgi:hypothetical protein